MASSGLKETTKVYRQLLKSVKKHIGSEDHKTHFTDLIKQEFRDSKSNHLKLAKDYTFLLNSVHHQKFYAGCRTPEPDTTLPVIRMWANLLAESISVHIKELLFSHNIAIDRTDEMKKVLKRSAASVGLQLPEVYKE